MADVGQLWVQRAHALGWEEPEIDRVASQIDANRDERTHLRVTRVKRDFVEVYIARDTKTGAISFRFQRTVRFERREKQWGVDIDSMSRIAANADSSPAIEEDLVCTTHPPDTHARVPCGFGQAPGYNGHECNAIVARKCAAHGFECCWPAHRAEKSDLSRCDLGIARRLGCDCPQGPRVKSMASNMWPTQQHKRDCRYYGKDPVRYIRMRTIPEIDAANAKSKSDVAQVLLLDEKTLRALRAQNKKLREQLNLSKQGRLV